MSGKVIIVDDHEVVRAGLRALLANTDFKVVAETTGGDGALKLIGKQKVDVIVMDIVTQNGDGMDVLAKIKREHPNIPVLLYSAYNNPAYIARAFGLGAVGYILKSEEKGKLIQALKAAVSGKTSWTREDQRLAKKGSSGASQLPPYHEELLTQRELEVLQQVAQGLTNKEIAFQLKISYETVKEHVQHLIQKLGVRDRTQAAVWAVRNGIV